MPVDSAVAETSALPGGSFPPEVMAISGEKMDQSMAIYGNS